jgi:predicted XRE-type DNA-binding protein
MSDTSDVEVMPGTTNVFADLGFPDAVEMQTKTRLAMHIAELVKRRRLKQGEAAQLLELDKSKSEALVNYQLDQFSVEELLRCLMRLDQAVEIVIRPRAPRGPAEQIVVTSVE